MATVIVRSLEKMLHVASGHQHSIVVDQPPPSGDDQGMSPTELMLASLGTWTAITLRLYAERKGWPLGDVTVELSHQKLDAKDCADCEPGLEGSVDVIRMHTLVTGPLTGEQEARLREIAGRCPIHKLLKGRPQIIEDLDVKVPGE